MAVDQMMMKKKKKVRRGVVHLQKVEDRNRRQSCFSKRKRGLFKKAHELSVLCDAGLAVIIFSDTGRPYQFCSTHCSLIKIIDRYNNHKNGEMKVLKNGNYIKMVQAMLRILRKGSNQEEMLTRHLGVRNMEKLDMSQLKQLEDHLRTLLEETRHMKTHVMLQTIENLQQKQAQITEDNLLLEKQISESGEQEYDPANLQINSSLLDHQALEPKNNQTSEFASVVAANHPIPDEILNLFW